MEQKAYAEVARSYVSNATVWRRYDSNDRAAGEVVDGEVKKRMQRTGEGYSVALKALRAEHGEVGFRLTNRPRPVVSHQQFVDTGKELQQIVGDLQKSGLPPKGKSYLVDACAMNPAMAAKYGYHLSGVDAQEILNYYSEGVRELKLHGQQNAVSKLWGLISGNKRDDGTIDWNAAAVAAKLAPAIAQDAAREKIETMTSAWIVQQGLAGPTADHLSTARSQIRRKNRELAAMADNGSDTTAESLKQIFPQFVKTRVKQITGVGMSPGF